VSVGKRHTCAIDVSERVFCWGSNNKMQVQSGQSPDSYYSPELVADSSSFTNANIRKVSLGENNTFVIDDDDDLFCWGENSSGQCGTASDLGNIAPVSVDTLNGFDSGNVAHVSAGSDHACASDNDGKIYCWGNNDKLKLGRSGADSPSPVLLDIGNIDSN
jgi:alpha-tubulin suppressor-like RCC1 family protein